MSEFDCCQPIPKPSICDSVIEMVMKRYNIKGEEEKSNLTLLFDLYSDIKMRERVTDAFLRLDSQLGGKNV